MNNKKAIPLIFQDKETYAIADKVFTDFEEAKAYAIKIAAQAPHGKTAQALLPVGNYTTNRKRNSDCKKPVDVKTTLAAAKPATKHKEQKMKRMTSPSTRKQKAPRPNPFAGAKDIYTTKSKIVVTNTKNTRTKRGFKQTIQTKYYEQNDSNTRLLKKAGHNTVRVGRTGNNYRAV